MITLKGNPISTQHAYKSGPTKHGIRHYMTEEAKVLKEQYQWEVKSQWNKKPTKEDVEVELYLYFGDKRKRDIDNFNKLVIDSMSGIVYEDDDQIQRLCINKEYDKNNPRVEIEIY